MVGRRSSHQLIMAPLIGLVLVVTIVALLCLCAAAQPVAYKTLTVVNTCNFSVWPAISVGSSNLPPPQMAEVPAGQTHSWNVDPYLDGSLWGRTDCVFDSQGVGSCDTGDCGGNLQCNNYSGNIAAITKVEFELLGGTAKPDMFDLTLESGYCLPMSVVPGISISPPCNSMACTANATVVCPKDLQLKKNGSVVTACDGHFDGSVPNPPSYGQAFQKACPNAFPFQSGSICPPETASYTINFCPPSI